MRDVIKPHNIDATQHFYDAFDHMETEISARIIVRMCQEHGDWFDFTDEDINKFYARLGFTGFSFNRLIHPGRSFSIMNGPYDVGGGWIVEENGKYHITDDFIARCYKSSPLNKIKCGA